MYEKGEAPGMASNSWVSKAYIDHLPMGHTYHKALNPLTTAHVNNALEGRHKYFTSLQAKAFLSYVSQDDSLVVRLVSKIRRIAPPVFSGEGGSNRSNFDGRWSQLGLPRCSQLAADH